MKWFKPVSSSDAETVTMPRGVWSWSRFWLVGCGWCGAACGSSAFLERSGYKELSEGFGGEIGYGFGVLSHLNGAQHGFDAVWRVGNLVVLVHLYKTRYSHHNPNSRITSSNSFIIMFEELKQWWMKDCGVTNLIRRQFLLAIGPSLLILLPSFRQPVLALLVVLGQHFLILVKPVWVIYNFVNQLIQ